LKLAVVVQPKKRYSYFDVSVDPMIQDGKVYGVILTATKLLRRIRISKDSQAILNSTTDRKNFVFDIPGIGKFGIWNWYVKTGKIYWSKEQENLFGLNDGEFSGTFREYLSFIYVEDLPLIQRKREFDDKTDSEHQYEYRVRRKDGQVRWIQTRSRTIFNSSAELEYITGINIDVTEQKQYQKLLEESEKQWKSIANAMPQLVWVADQWGKVIYYNKRISEFKGVVQFADGRWNSEMLIHPEDLHSTAEAWKKAFTEGSAYEQEHRLQVKDGSFRWHLSRAIPYRNQDGEIRKWYGTATDIHDLKAAQEKLKESETRFRSLAENSPDVITRHARDFTYLYASPPIEKHLGIKGTDFIGKTYWELGFPTVLCEFFDRHLTVAFQTRELQTIEFEMAGSVYVLSRLVPEFNEEGEMVSVLILSTDISERKKAERKLQYLATLTHSIPDAVIAIDMEDKITSWNLGAEKIYGWSEDEVIGKGSRDVLQTQFSETDQSSWLHAVERDGFWQGEVIQYKKDRTTVPIHVSISYVRDNSGNVIGQVGVNRDISDLKRAEEALKSAKEQLEASFRSFPSGIYLFNPEGRILFVNETAAKLNGYDSAVEMLSEKNIEETRRRAFETYALSDEDGKPLSPGDSAIARTFKTGKPAQIIFCAAHRANNSRTWILAKSAPIFGADGKLSMVMSTVTDITLQKTAEEKIRHSEEQLRMALAGGELGWYDYNAETGMLLWSDQCKKFFGLPDDAEVSLETYAKGIHPEDLDVTVEAATNAMKGKTGGRFEHEYRVVALDKKVRWIRSKGTVYFNESGRAKRFAGVMQDITLRRETELTLKTTKNQLEKLFYNFPSCIFLFDGSGKLLFANDNAAAFTGFNSAQEMLAEQDFATTRTRAIQTHDFYLESGDEMTAKRSPTFITLASGIASQLVIRAVNKISGETTWHLSKATPLLDDSKKVSFVLSTVTDITIQKTAEEKIRLSEKRYSTLTQATTSVIWVMSPHATFEIPQPSWEAYTGQLWPEYRGSGWLHMIHEDDRKNIVTLWKQALHERRMYEASGRIWSKRFTGYRYFESKAIPLLNYAGEISEWVGMITDVHEQRMADQRMKESEERFRTLAESLPQLIWMTDAHGNAEYSSTQWTEYSGIDFNLKTAWNEFLHPEDMPFIMKAWNQSLSTGEKYHAECRLRKKNGEYRWHTVNGEPLRNSANQITRWIGAFTDIHDQKTLNEKLEALVEARTSQLQRSNEDLLQFAHVTSHDLKEPVRKIRTFSELLAQAAGDTLPEKAQAYLNKIEASSNRIYEMIEGVLRYSSVDAVNRINEKVDLNAVFHNIESDLELIIQEKKATIQYHEFPVIRGSSVLLYQLFYNLINNSLKFSRTGLPPVIKVTCSEEKEKEKGKKSGAAKSVFVIQVSDNGIGFDSKYADQIFKTFIRLHSKDKYEGTGLGLSLCKKIVERHGGWISAVSQENQGSTFRIVLPS
jgi:PAS domain S-box-containing protein